MSGLFNKTFDVLSGMLQYRSQKHQVGLSNIANLETPDFRGSDVVLKSAPGKQGAGRIDVTKTHERHLPAGSFASQLAATEVVRSEERVNLDQEMSKLSENHLMFNATMEMMSRKLRSIKTTLTETK